MNICMVIDRLDVGGAERVAMTLADKLLEDGHNITIITIDPIIKIQTNPLIRLHTLHFEKKLFKYTYNRKKMYALLDKCQQETSRFDLILVHLYKSSRIMKFYSHPCIYHIVHSTQSKSALKDKQGIKRWIAWRKIKSVYDNLNLICVSKGVQDDLLSIMKIQPKTIQTIYNPFDIHWIQEQSKLTKSVSTPQEYIIFVGRLVKEKRVDYLLHAYAKSKISQYLLVVGDGEEQDRLKNLSVELHIEDKVYFVGSVLNPYPLIKDAKFLVLCSQYEGLPTVLIEALILQTPLIVTNFHSGPKEILPYYTIDALVEDNFDNDLLADKLIQFSIQAPVVEQNCMESFSSEKISKEYIGLIFNCNERV